MTNDLIGYWAFDEGTGLIAGDSSGNGHAGTLLNGPLWAPGTIGGALNFDGVNDRVDLGDVLNVSGPGLTISAWMYPRSLGQNSMGRILDKQDTLSTGYSFSINAGRLNLKINNKDHFSPSNAITLNRWQHVVSTYDGANVQYYKNGLPFAAPLAETATPAANSVPLQFGNRVSGDRTFDGLLDDLRIYNRALSSAEVQQLYQGGSGSSPTPSPTTSPSASPTPSATASPSATSSASASPTATFTPTPSPTPGSSPVASATPSPPDTVPPVISAVAVSRITTSSAVISWMTDQSADSTVRYGTSAEYGFQVTSPDCTTSHQLSLTGLSPDTVYHYQIVSTDAVGNVRVSNDFLFSVPPTNVIWPGRNWVTTSPAEMGMDADLLTQARDYALSTGEGGGSGMIVRRGRVVFSWGATNTKYDLKSTTKSIGSAALGLFLKDRLGAVTITDRAIDFHPSLGIPPQSNADTGWLPGITLLNLATHTAGFNKDGGYSALLFEPGTAWRYSDGGANWLAEALTLSYHEDLRALLFDRVFTQLGIRTTDLTWRRNLYRPKTIDGVENREFGAGVSANVDAMARFGYLFLRKGNWNGEQILGPDFVDLVHSPHSLVRGLPMYQPPVYVATNSPRHYGVLWWNNADASLSNVPSDTFMSWGLGESLIIVIPSLDIVVARAGNAWRSDNTSDFYSVLGPFLTYIVNSIQN